MTVEKVHAGLNLAPLGQLGRKSAVVGLPVLVSMIQISQLDRYIGWEIVWSSGGWHGRASGRCDTLWVSVLHGDMGGKILGGMVNGCME
jgi:hypothetical protein